ncbi:MAG: aminotransferase class V-fold PLP-dependent enzyme [Actinomycetota bacterium]|nr:aminotransferase class V-fold PLP-dependent enzyme [Actinomycetota bacterium]
MRAGTHTIDPATLRPLFPSLTRTVGGRPCVFADSPGGTQTPDTVVQAMADHLRRGTSNEGGPGITSRETDALIEDAHRAAADFLGARPHEVVIGANMTTLAFALSRSLARTLGPGDEVVVSTLDHDANIAPWVAAAEDSGAFVRWVDFRTEDCTLDLRSLQAALSRRTRIIALTLASNAVGSVTPASEVVAAIRSATEALIVFDAVHLAPHRTIDVAALDADFLFCSPYKFFGPHLGLMFGRKELLDGLRPYKVAPSSDLAPHRWETGTGNHEGMAGLVAAIDYLAALGSGGTGEVGRRPSVDGEVKEPGRRGPAPRGEVEATGDRRAALIRAGKAVATWEAGLTVRWLEGLTSLPKVRLYGIADPGRAGERTPTFAVRVDGLHPRSVAEALGRTGIFVWDGNYYAQKLMERLDLEGSGGAVRIGFCHFNTLEEVDLVLDEVRALS